MNTITVVGNIGQDPDIRYFESGSVKCAFSIADRQRKKDAPPIWWRVEAWNKLGETVANCCRKGSKIVVSGSVKEERWTSEGQDKSALVINANAVGFLDPKAKDKAEDSDEDGDEIAASVKTTKKASKAQSKTDDNADPDYDSIPF